MHRLKAMTSFGKDTELNETVGTINILENTNCAIASIAVRNGKGATVKKALKSKFDLTIPDPLHMTTSGNVSLIWVGPEQYFFTAPFEGFENIAEILIDSLQDTASITEQTDAWVQFDLSGTAVVDAFKYLCMIDVEKFDVNSSTRTIIEHLGCIVIRNGETKFSILGPRSSASALHHTIKNAASLLL